MIKFLPSIYPDEAVYSYLSRIYARSGYIWNSGFAQEIFERHTANIDCSFLNVFAPHFKRLIDEKIDFKRLLLDHTLFKYYVRFLPLERRISITAKALQNDTPIGRYLPIPLQTNTSSLRYCPLCIKADREKYGEAYIHITHSIPYITVCPIHASRLFDVEFIAHKINNTAFVPLEHCITNMDIINIAEDNINVCLARYIAEVFGAPLNLEDEVIIGNFLSNKLEDKYISPRGEQRYISHIWNDLQVFYSGLENLYTTQNRLATVYKCNSYNPYDILIISLFQKIKPCDLSSFNGTSEPKHIVLDNKVRSLHESGLSMNRIALMLGINHEVVRQILLGTYDEPKHACSSYKCTKWDWDSIDQRCCEEFPRRILEITTITKATVAEAFNLKDKSLRNLPRLNAMIQNYKVANRN